MTAAAQVREAARRIRRLSPDWRNPERFFEDRSEIEREMHRLARQLEEQDHG